MDPAVPSAFIATLPPFQFHSGSTEHFTIRGPDVGELIQLIIQVITCMYVTGLELVAHNKLLWLAIATEMSGNFKFKRVWRTKTTCGEEGCVHLKLWLPTLAVHNHVHVLSLLTVLCDACTLQCLKSKFFVPCSMMGENASRGGSLMRYKWQILANHKHGRSLATSGCHCMKVIVKCDGVWNLWFIKRLKKLVRPA